MATILRGQRSRAFLRTGISFGIAMGVMAAAEGDSYLAIPIGIVAGSLFGAIMVLVGLVGERRLKKRGFAATSMDPRQKRELETDRPTAEAFDAALGAVKEIRKFRSADTDLQAGRIVARIGMTWQSFGELVTIEISERPGRKTAVLISSLPRVQGTVGDSGKGVENVEAFLKAFQARVPGTLSATSA